MTERKTTSILQRVPIILAVTAASYGMVGAVRPADAGRTPAKQGAKAPKQLAVTAPPRSVKS